MPGGNQLTRRGFALVTVLWIVLILGVFAAGIADIAQRGGQRSVVSANSVEAEALLDAAIARAVWSIKRAQDARAVSANGLISRDKLSKGETAVRVTPASSLIDLNAATPAVIAALASDIDNDAVTEIQQAFEDEKGQLHSVQGIVAVLSKEGLSRASISSVFHQVTVYSGDLAPDLSSAPKDVLKLLPGLDSTQIDAILEARLNGTILTPPIPDGWQYLPGSLRPIGPVYHIEAVVRTNNGTERGRSEVIYIPLPETQPELPYYRLETWAIPVTLPVFQELID